MKTMSDYTLYCTEEQTRKALELGAPIETRWDYGESSTKTFEKEIPIEFRYYAKIPTAEQMISWLEEQNMLFVIDPYTKDRYCCAFNHGTEYVMDSHVGTRKEATLAAIDAALEYLSNNKK